MPTPRPNAARLIAAALATVLASVALVVTIADDDQDGRPDRVAITVKVDGPAPGRAQDTTVTVPAPAVAEARAGAADHAGQAREVLPDVPAQELEAGRAQQDRLARTDQLPVVSPDAAPEQAGCASRFVRNYSSRRGVRPRLLVVHYTVSPNRPGWSDVNAITSLFDRASFQASSHYIIDAEGHCAYIVRESDKAWTQAGFNPTSISVEVINTGREGRLLDPAGYRKLGRVFADAAKRWDIPIRRGTISGCTVTRSGIVDHNQLKVCGGGHVDITPYPLEPVITATTAARSSGTPTTATDRRRCGALADHRRKVRTGQGYWTPTRVRRARYLKTTLARAGIDASRCR